MLKIYNELLNKIRTTRDYIVKLETLMGCMSLDLEENKIDIKVLDILYKCRDDINEIYINHECAVNTDEVIDGYNERQEVVTLNEDIIHTLNTIGIVDDLKPSHFKDHLMNMFSLMIDDNTISEPKLTNDYRSCNDEYKAKLNDDNLDEKSSK